MIDAYSAFLADGRPQSVLVRDGVHPSEAGNALWAYDSASSWSLRKNPDSATRYQVQIFGWLNCNTEGNHRTYVVGQDYAVSDLRTIGWNNTAASVRVTIAP